MRRRAWTPEKRASHGRMLAALSYRRGRRMPEELTEEEIMDYRRLTRSCRYRRAEAVNIILGGRRGQMA
jgi:hypothetical protein